MGRRKKNKITYDSKETSTIAGLFFLVLGLFFLISIFTSTETENNLFSQVKSAFGNATLLTAIYLLLVGLRFLGTRTIITKTRSLVAQLFVLLGITALMTSFTASPSELIKLTGEETNGGKVGYYIVVNLFGDKIPTEPATKFILIALTAIFIIIAAPISAKQLVTYISKALTWLKNGIYVLFFDDSEESGEEEIYEELETKDKTARLGDFNKLIAQRKLNGQMGLEDNAREEKRNFSEFNEQVMHHKKIASSVAAPEIKERSLAEESLHNDQLEYPDWKLPPMSLLIPFKKTQAKEAFIKQNADVIEQILESFGIEAKVEDSYVGPSVVQYALSIPMGVNVKKIANLSENIALALGVDSKAVRIESIPETSYLGIEIPRSQRDLVRFKELMSSNEMVTCDFKLPVVIGKDIDGSAIVAGIEKMPHLLIAGATGSGKSVLTNSFITSLIMRRTPDEVKLILVDPKRVELGDYNGIPHLLTPVITDMDKVVNALKWAVKEMEKRYTVLEAEQVRNIDGYNKKKGFAAMPYIVIVIDEMADMMMTANRVDTETAIVRIAQKARAVGIHLILATQRPSVNVITGIIKANIPGRVGMSVTSSTDSRVILDRIGAESLMGNGDLLYKAPDKNKSSRLQGAFVDQEEVIKVVDFLKAQSPEVAYINEITEKPLSPEELSQGALGDVSEDNLVEQAIRIVVQSGKGSSSYLQRRLNIGFNRAARLLEELEEAGVVGPQVGSRPREVLISDADEFISSLRAQG